MSQKEIKIMQPNYPIQESFIRIRNWKPISPLPFTWKMKPLLLAQINPCDLPRHDLRTILQSLPQMRGLDFLTPRQIRDGA